LVAYEHLHSDEENATELFESSPLYQSLQEIPISIFDIDNIIKDIEMKVAGNIQDSEDSSELENAFIDHDEILMD
jgi:hypothetical protein